MSKNNLKNFILDPATGVHRASLGENAFSYSDGEAEERSLMAAIEQAKDRSIWSDAFRKEQDNWALEYHLTPMRHNLMRHLAFSKNSNLLELGAGCGAITRQLGELGLEVTAIEGSLTRAHIARARCRDLSNVKVYNANFAEVTTDEKFDYVSLIGVLEYSRQFVKGKDPVQEVLKHALSFLKPEGALIVAIENQLGYKYLCGFTEDHTSIKYQGVEDLYKNDSPVTFGKGELEERLRDAGFSEVAFNYPYPDYKVPRFILTDAGNKHPDFESWEIIRQITPRDYSDPKLVTELNPDLTAPVLGRNRLLGDLANSFLVIAAKERAAIQDLLRPELLGVYYATDRGVSYWTGTEFIADEHQITVRKKKIHPAALEPAKKALTQQLNDQPYLKGKNLYAEMKKAVKVSDFALLSHWVSRLIEFVEAEGLAEARREEGVYTRIKSDWFDAIPANVIITDSGLQLIDREWILNAEMNLGHIILRIIDEVGRIDSEIPEIRQDRFLTAFAEAGYEIKGDIIASYNHLLESVSEQVYNSPFLVKDGESRIQVSSTIEMAGASVKDQTGKPAVRAVAFYLPQFHPVPENDEWWGRGFTEWTNVGKANPLFKDHYQPRVPADLGYYDLRVPETRELQAELAKAAGIEAFCYWHYWFGGKRILERPLEEVIQTKSPDFGFCIGWANSSWTGIWHGAANRVLIEQTYPGYEDYKNHFYAMLPALRDERYFRVGGKPLVLIYAPHEIPNARSFVDYWKELAHNEGVGDLYFVAHMSSDPLPYGCDSAVDNAPFTKIPSDQINVERLAGREPPRVWNYSQFVDYMREKPLGTLEHPLVFPNWDNSPRSGSRGIALHGSSPELYHEHLRDAVKKAQKFADKEQQIVFIKAWNEWAEGNYLEPDQKFGLRYLEATKAALYGAPYNTGTAVKAATEVITSEIATFPANGIHTSSNGSSIQVVVEKADNLASAGSLEAAIEVIKPHAPAGNYPGLHMRLAKWNHTLGRRHEAVRAAVEELLTRPDNDAAFEMVISNSDILLNALSGAPESKIKKLEQIVNAYAQQAKG